MRGQAERSELGRQVYATYSEEILREHFSGMFNVLKEIPPEYLPVIAKALKQPSLASRAEVESAPVLIPCKRKCCDEDEE